MSLQLLSDLTGYEVSLVPFGANRKKRFLVTKEHGELTMDELLEQILKEGLKDEEAISKVAKNLDLKDDEEKVLKAIMKMVGGEHGLSKEKLMKALGAMGVEKEYPKKDEDETSMKKEDDSSKKDDSDSTSINKEGDKPTSKGGSVSGKVPVQKEDGSWDLSGVDESIRPSLEVICKANTTLQKSLTEVSKEKKTLADQLKAEKDARVLKEFEEKALEYGHIGEDAKALAKVLKAAHDSDPENGKAIEAILKSANEKIEKAGLFNELGSSGSGGAPGGGTAWAKIEKQADKIAEEKSISHAEAVDLVMKKHPELYKEYQDEKRRTA